MPYSNSPIAALTAQGGPKAGYTSFTPQLLGGDLREAAGLGIPPAPANTGEAAGLGKDDFLKLLLAQLSNQDPLKPLEDKEFITQLAQFNTLEQMQAMNKNLVDMLAGMSLASASDMIGKTVRVSTASGMAQGVVTAVTMTDGKAKLSVTSGDEVVQVSLTQVTAVLGVDAE